MKKKYVLISLVTKKELTKEPYGRRLLESISKVPQLTFPPCDLNQIN
jgi:hypothetical protein